MRRPMSESNQQHNGYIDVSRNIYEMGVFHIQREEWNIALVQFDGSLQFYGEAFQRIFLT